MNTQRCSKETCTGSSSSHVGQAMNVHEQVINDNRSINEASKEAAGHQ